MATRDYPRIVISTDGERGLILHEFEGKGKLRGRAAVAYCFCIGLEPAGPASRLCVLFDRWVHNQIPSATPQYGLPQFDDPEDGGLVFAEAAIGDHISVVPFPEFTPSGLDPYEIPCLSQAFAEWRERARASEEVLQKYVEAKLYWAWRFDQLVVRFEFSDLLRHRAPMTTFHKIALVGEGEDWTVVHQGPNHLHLRPAPALVRRFASRTRVIHDFQTHGRPQLSESEIAGIWKLLHPQITRLARPRFESGHYADAVEAALKHVNSEVRKIMLAAGQPELDGAAMMFRAFGGDRPPITLEELVTESGRNVQQGYAHLFAGAMLGIRNPKAHGNIQLAPERALHLLVLASLLLDRLEERRSPVNE